MPKLNISELQKEHIKEWLVALRSGEYKQCRHLLRNTVSYCCLGVACDISKMGKWKDNGFYDGGLEDILGTVRHIMFNHYGISDSKCTTLVNKNDYDKLDFNEIADYIETEMLCPTQEVCL